MGCREFFDQHGDDDKKCKRLHSRSEAELAQWEAETASADSPGVVLDSEILYQQVTDPTHLSPDGRALMAKTFDVCNSHGLSTHRLAHTSVHRIVEMCEARLQEQNSSRPGLVNRTLWGFVPYLVGDVRQLRSLPTEARGLFVFDTASNDDPSHAEICQGATPDKELQREMRQELYDMVRDTLIPLRKFLENDGIKTTNPLNAA